MLAAVDRPRCVLQLYMCVLRVRLRIGSCISECRLTLCRGYIHHDIARFQSVVLRCARGFCQQLGNGHSIKFEI